MQWNRLFQQFVNFTGLSGLCWCIDFSIFFILTRWWGYTPFWGNMISATVAATLAFLLSTRFVFVRNEGKLNRKLAFYLVYNTVMIVLASAVLKWLALQPLLLSFHISAVVLAKILITPVLMMCNFLVSKLTTEKLKI